MKLSLCNIIVFSTLSFYLPIAYGQVPYQQQLIVVEDFGGAPAQPYYEAMGLTADKLPRPQVPAMPLRQVDDSFVLPVQSSLLTPGNVALRQISAPGLSPIFLIGDDELSLRWLVKRYQELLEIHAVGLVVQVDSVQSLQHLRAIAPKLTLVPVNGNDIAQRLQLKHYPVLITDRIIEQ